MSDVTVRKLAQTVGAPVEKLISQLVEAGIGEKTADDKITIAEKSKLLAFLRQSHGKAKTLSGSPAKLSLKKKTLSTSTSTSSPKTGRKVNIAVKGKRVVSKPTITTSPAKTAASAVIEQNRKSEISEKMARKEAENKEFEEKRRKAIEEIQAKEKEKQEKKKETDVGGVVAPVVVETEESKAAAAKVKGKVIKQVEDVAEEDVAKILETPKTKKKKKKVVRNEDEFKAKIYTAQDEAVADAILSKREKAKAVKKLRVENRHGFARPAAPIVKEVELFDENAVSQLAQSMAVKAPLVIKTLMGMGVMATINESIDRDTATLVVEELGHSVKHRSDTDLEDNIQNAINQKDRGDKTQRPPVVTVMGHVDHGKTSLLDYIRKAKVTTGEAGGITQHIGSYHVETDHGVITFLDTPGHAAFTAMRARGAKVTDIIVLVVAADDGVMPQTIEAIQHAQAAEVPIIVAVNKVDKEDANPERVRKELTNHNIIPEDWGGENMFVEVSAKAGTGIDDLLEAINLQADVLELEGYGEGYANGIVIESRLDKGRGTVASILVQNGVLKQGDIVLVGAEYGRVRAMHDENGRKIKSAGPSIPVEVLGLSGTPHAGDDFLVMETDRKAREVAEHRKEQIKAAGSSSKTGMSMEDFFAKAAEDKMKVLNIVLKADVQGSFEAIKDSLNKIVTDEVRVNIIGGGVGGIRETDATLAMASNSIMIGFNVRADGKARQLVQDNNIDLKYYSVIYNLIDDVRDAVSGMLTPEIREQIIGIAEVRDVFRSPKFGAIAGCMVIEGVVKISAPIRVLREEVVIYEGELESLRRFKDQVNDVHMGTECGIGVKNYNDVQSGDLIEVFERTEIKRKVEG